MNKNTTLFYSIVDFYMNKEEIKEKYILMTDDEKRQVKKDVYSLCFENEYAKDCIWEYLNCLEGEELLCLSNLSIEYRRRRR